MSDFEIELKSIWLATEERAKIVEERVYKLEDKVYGADVEEAFLTSKVDELEKARDSLRDDVAYLKSQSMRNNLIFTNITEDNSDENESPEVTEVIKLAKTTADRVFALREYNVHRSPGQPVSVLSDDVFPCWIIVVIFIVAARIQFFQTWFAGYGMNKMSRDSNHTHRLVLAIVLASTMPVIGFVIIFCLQSKYFEPAKEDKSTFPNWAIFIVLVIGVFDPALGIASIGIVYSIKYKCKDALMLSVAVVLSFLLVAGVEIILVIRCTEFIDVWYYVVIPGCVYLLLLASSCGGCMTALCKNWKESTSANTSTNNLQWGDKQKKNATWFDLGKQTTANKTSVNNLQWGYKQNKIAPIDPGKQTTANKTSVNNLQWGYKQNKIAPTDPVPCVCDSCNRICNTMKGYCMKCNMFLCDSCLSKHTCTYCTVRHLQHEAEGRETEIRCDTEHKKRNLTYSAHGYCLDCHMYLCTICLIKHNHHDLLWIPNHNDITKDRLCCYRGHTDRGEITLLGYCMRCEEYLCTCNGCVKKHAKHFVVMHNWQDISKDYGLWCYRGQTDRREIPPLGYCMHCEEYMFTFKECIERHAKHFVVMHHQQGSLFENTQEIICGKCNPKKKPRSKAECFHFNSQNYLCSDCYEHDRIPVRRVTDDESKREIIRSRSSCEIHHVFGDGHVQYSTTDVFCLICHIYMCKSCYKLHRRLKEDWMKKHESNLFICKRCQEKGDLYPVECLLLEPPILLCAECFESTENNYFSVPEIQDKSVRQTLMSRYIIKTPCQLHKFPFQMWDDTVNADESTVYCLLCNAYMCTNCFRKHRRLKEVFQDCIKFKTQEAEKERQIRNTPFKRVPKRQYVEMTDIRYPE